MVWRLHRDLARPSTKGIVKFIITAASDFRFRLHGTHSKVRAAAVPRKESRFVVGMFLNPIVIEPVSERRDLFEDGEALVLAQVPGLEQIDVPGPGTSKSRKTVYSPNRAGGSASHKLRTPCCSSKSVSQIQYNLSKRSGQTLPRGVGDKYPA